MRNSSCLDLRATRQSASSQSESHSSRGTSPQLPSIDGCVYRYAAVSNKPVSSSLTGLLVSEANVLRERDVMKFTEACCSFVPVATLLFCPSLLLNSLFFVIQFQEFSVFVLCSLPHRFPYPFITAPHLMMLL
jgi:hypothetical protein